MSHIASALPYQAFILLTVFAFFMALYMFKRSNFYQRLIYFSMAISILLMTFAKISDEFSWKDPLELIFIVSGAIVMFAGIFIATRINKSR